MSTGRFRFRLYVVHNAPNSVRATANLNAFCREYLPDCHEIEIVDVMKDPKRALSDGISLTPTLVRLSPEPELRIVGSLSQTQVLIDAFQVERRVA